MVMVNRCNGVAEGIIRSNQAYGLSGRDIADSILTVQAAFRGLGEEGRIILSLDFEKAFDRVSHDFLFKALEKVGWRGKFAEILKGIYRKCTSKIKVSGYVSSELKMGRSVDKAALYRRFCFLVC